MKKDNMQSLRNDKKNMENHSKKKTISIKHFSRNKLGTISNDIESR